MGTYGSHYVCDRLKFKTDDLTSDRKVSLSLISVGNQEKEHHLPTYPGPVHRSHKSRTNTKVSNSSNS